MTFYLANARAKNLQPSNTTVALLPALEMELRRELKRRDGRHRFQVEHGLKRFSDWLAQIGAADQESQAQSV
jgi:hypothetical protein